MRPHSLRGLPGGGIGQDVEQALHLAQVLLPVCSQTHVSWRGSSNPVPVWTLTLILVDFVDHPAQRFDVFGQLFQLLHVLLVLQRRGSSRTHDRAGVTCSAGERSGSNSEPNWGNWDKRGFERTAERLTVPGVLSGPGDGTL